jgi:Tfp pilus assembly protein PilP
MRLAKISRTLLLLALPAGLATCALAQDHPNVQPSAVRDQLTKQVPGASQPQPAAPKAPAPKPATSPAKAQAPAKGATPPPAKGNQQPKASTPAAAAKSPATPKAPAKAVSQKPAKPPVEKPAGEKVSVARRDPFDTLLNKARAGNAPPDNLPPGKAGLVVGTLRIDGIVHGSGGMIAIVSNPQQRVYFLREGDKLYDGSVEHITLEAISFHEIGKDAFGKPLERQVTKRLYPSPGEQQ